LNAASDGAVLPILHLNGYKIANPTLLAVSLAKVGTVVPRLRVDAVLCRGPRAGSHA